MEPSHLRSPTSNYSLGSGLSLNLVKKIGWQIASVLSLFSFEDLKLVHGQISPANIFLKKKNGFEVRLVDFSKAFYLDDDRILASTGQEDRSQEKSLETAPCTIALKSRYMSPELSDFITRCPNMPQ